MKSKKRFWKSWLALLLAVILSLQGTEPVFVQAKEISENKIRDVDFSKPEALTAEEAGIEDKTNDSADDSKETRKKKTLWMKVEKQQNNRKIIWKPEKTRRRIRKRIQMVI